MPSSHTYRATVQWTGNLGAGTREYRGYSRDHTLGASGKPPIPGSSGLSPRSDPTRYNPEELLVAALSACHMLWYLHLCSNAGVTVASYEDEAEGTMETESDGAGRFTRATLRPRVVLSEGSTDVARRLHEEAHRKCFIANSVNFPVTCQPVIEVESAPLDPE
jgi:organic hydroperoxide reductase OsmC/OhrA